MADVVINNMNKVYPNGVQAVFDFNLTIEHGEFIVLVGPSGCGKSTTLRMIAGLEDISSGELKINDKLVNNVAPKDRDIAMVFQNYALYGHMTVYHNMAFSLLLRKFDSEEIHRRVMKAAEILDLVKFLNRKPAQLSGGQRQRVALGRAIVRDPKVFLLDEPLSNLDAKLRGVMRKELMVLHHRLNATMVYVTHDQIEALTLADRIVVMKDGYIQQIASPKEIFDNPENKFVAEFIGTPPMNFYTGLITEDGKFQIKDPNSGLTNTKIKITQDKFNVLKELGYVGKEVYMASRPDYVYVDNAHLFENSEAKFNIDVDYEELLGAYKLIYGNVEGNRIIIKVDSRVEVSDDNVTEAAFDMNKVHFFDMTTEKRIYIREEEAK